MKIKDILLDWVIETDLFEMAFKRKIVVDKVRDHQIQIARHLIKHLYYDVPEETKRHWAKEIDAWLSTIDDYRLKGGKALDGSVYYELLFKEPLGEREAVVRNIKKINRDDDMNDKQGLVAIDVLHQQLEKILHRVAYDLGNDKLQDIQKYIEECNI